MSKARFAAFGGVLALMVGLAVSSLIAQDRPADRAREQAERVRPRVMMLEGRGAQIGVMVDDLTADELQAAGKAGGVRITDVDDDSPAAAAGLRSGDIVVEFAGERVRSARQFSRLVQETPSGRTVAVTVLRDGERQALNVTPEARTREFDWAFDADRIGREVEQSLREVEPRLRELEPRLRELEPRLREFRYGAPFNFDFDMLPRMSSPRGRLGVQLQELSPQLAEYFGAGDGGVLVSSVTPDSPAARAGLKAGDVITSIDGDRVRDTNDLIDELRDKEGEVRVGILRDKQESSVTATLEEARPRRPVTRRPAA